MKPEAILPTYIDSTMLTCFRSCPEKFRLEFVYGLRPPGLSIDLHAGACFALAIETVYRAFWEEGKSLQDALVKAHGVYAVAWGDFEIPTWKATGKTFDRVWEAVEEYFKTWTPRTDHIQPYFTDGKATFEYTFSIPLEPVVSFDPIRTNMEDRDEIYRTHFPTHPCGEPFMYSGRFDMLGSYLGKPVVRDEKTSGRTAGDGWADQWNLRNQFIGYTWACQQSGIDVDSVCVRGVSILKTKIGMVEAIKPYSDFLRAKWLEQVRRDLWRLRRAWDEGYFDLNLADTCTAYGNCIFMDICASREPEAWMNQFTVNRWNPLLKNPIQEAA